MKAWKIVLIVIAGLVVLIGLDFAFGYLGVFKTRTVGKAQQDAEREVFERTQSYVEGKRQMAVKYYREYNEATDEADKKTLRTYVANEFANLSDKEIDHYFDEPLRGFIMECKYGKTKSVLDLN